MNAVHIDIFLAAVGSPLLTLISPNSPLRFGINYFNNHGRGNSCGVVENLTSKVFSEDLST